MSCICFMGRPILPPVVKHKVLELEQKQDKQSAADVWLLSLNREEAVDVLLNNFTYPDVPQTCCKIHTSYSIGIANNYAAYSCCRHNCTNYASYKNDAQLPIILPRNVQKKSVAVVTALGQPSKLEVMSGDQFSGSVLQTYKEELILQSKALQEEQPKWLLQQKQKEHLRQQKMQISTTESICNKSSENIILEALDPSCLPIATPVEHQLPEVAKQQQHRLENYLLELTGQPLPCSRAMSDRMTQSWSPAVSATSPEKAEATASVDVSQNGSLGDVSSIHSAESEDLLNSPNSEELPKWLQEASALRQKNNHNGRSIGSNYLDSYLGNLTQHSWLGYSPSTPSQQSPCTPKRVYLHPRTYFKKEPLTPKNLFMSRSFTEGMSETGQDLFGVKTDLCGIPEGPKNKTDLTFLEEAAEKKCFSMTVINTRDILELDGTVCQITNSELSLAPASACESGVVCDEEIKSHSNVAHPSDGNLNDAITASGDTEQSFALDSLETDAPGFTTETSGVITHATDDEELDSNAEEDHLEVVDEELTISENFPDIPFESETDEAPTEPRGILQRSERKFSPADNVTLQNKKDRGQSRSTVTFDIGSEDNSAASDESSCCTQPSTIQIMEGRASPRHICFTQAKKSVLRYNELVKPSAVDEAVRGMSTKLTEITGESKLLGSNGLLIDSDIKSQADKFQSEKKSIAKNSEIPVESKLDNRKFNNNKTGEIIKEQNSAPQNDRIVDNMNTLNNLKNLHSNLNENTNYEFIKVNDEYHDNSLNTSPKSDENDNSVCDEPVSGHHTSTHTTTTATTTRSVSFDFSNKSRTSTPETSGRTSTPEASVMSTSSISVEALCSSMAGSEDVNNDESHVTSTCASDTETLHLNSCGSAETESGEIGESSALASRDFVKGSHHVSATSEGGGGNVNASEPLYSITTVAGKRSFISDGSGSSSAMLCSPSSVCMSTISSVSAPYCPPSVIPSPVFSSAMTPSLHGAAFPGPPPSLQSRVTTPLSSPHRHSTPTTPSNSLYSPITGSGAPILGKCSSRQHQMNALLQLLRVQHHHEREQLILKQQEEMQQFMQHLQKLSPTQLQHIVSTQVSSVQSNKAMTSASRSADAESRTPDGASETPPSASFHTADTSSSPCEDSYNRSSSLHSEGKTVSNHTNVMPSFYLHKPASSNQGGNTTPVHLNKLFLPFPAVKKASPVGSGPKVCTPPHYPKSGSVFHTSLQSASDLSLGKGFARSQSDGASPSGNDHYNHEARSRPCMGDDSIIKAKVLKSTAAPGTKLTPIMPREDMAELSSSLINSDLFNSLHSSVLSDNGRNSKLTSETFLSAGAVLRPPGRKDQLPRHRREEEPAVQHAAVILQAAVRGRHVRLLVASSCVQRLAATVKEVAKLATQFHRDLVAENISKGDIDFHRALYQQEQKARQELWRIFFASSFSEQLRLIHRERALQRRCKLPATLARPVARCPSNGKSRALNASTVSTASQPPQSKISPCSAPGRIRSSSNGKQLPVQRKTLQAEAHTVKLRPNNAYSHVQSRYLANFSRPLTSRPKPDSLTKTKVTRLLGSCVPQPRLLLPNCAASAILSSARPHNEKICQQRASAVAAQQQLLKSTPSNGVKKVLPPTPTGKGERRNGRKLWR